MTSEQIQALLILVTLVVAGFSLYKSYSRSGQITLTEAVDTVRESRPVAIELMEVAQIAVNSAEQLRREGKINSNDAAFGYALDYVKKWLPTGFQVDNEDIIAAINAAVLVASALRKQAGASSEHGTP